MLRTRVAEDVIVIATGFILFFVANHSFDDSYVGKQGESEKEKGTEVVKEFLFEKHQQVPLMQQCNKNVENGVKNIQSINR